MSNQLIISNSLKNKLINTLTVMFDKFEDYKYANGFEDTKEFNALRDCLNKLKEIE